MLLFDDFHECSYVQVLITIIDNGSRFLPSGKRLHNYGKANFFMGKLTIWNGPCSMAM